MHVHERIVANTVAETPIGWFAARQPGVMRFLEDRLSGDALAVALDGAAKIFRAFSQHDGVPPGRLTHSILERAEEATVTESLSSTLVTDGCAARQPALIAWVADLVAQPPIPLEPGECWEIAVCLSSIIYGFDQLTTGRLIP